MSKQTKPEQMLAMLEQLAAKLEKKIDATDALGRDSWQDRADASAIRFALQEIDALHKVLASLGLPWTALYLLRAIRGKEDHGDRAIKERL